MIGKAGLLTIDELGYVPVDEEGSRLLFQVAANAYERQSVIFTTNIESGGWGRVFGDSYRRTHALMKQPTHDSNANGRQEPGAQMDQFLPPTWTKTTRSNGPLQLDKTQSSIPSTSSGNNT